MYMILTFLLITSLASSLSFVLLLAVQRIFEYSYTWLYNLMKVIVVFYLFPAVCFILVLVLRNIENRFAIMQNPDFYHFMIYGKIPLSKTYFNVPIIEILFYIWVIGVIVSLFLTLISGICFENKIQKISETSKDINTNLIFESVKKDLKIKKCVRLYLCPVIISPFTCGIIHSVIVLPDIQYNELELKLILKHELIHLKGNDVIYKQLAAIVNILHWFNPFSYWFVNRMHLYCELACDVRVIDSETKNIRILYARLIIKMLEICSTKQEYITISSFENNEEKIKKRLEIIMKNKTFTKYQKIGLALISAIILAVCPIISYASTASMLSVQDYTAFDVLLDEQADIDGEFVEITDNTFGFTVPAGATIIATTRGDNRIDADINAGKILWTNEAKLSDGYIKVSLTADSSNDTFTVGYTRKGGSGKKVYSKDGGVSHSFSITADTYTVYIQNTSNHAIHVSGRITV